MFYLKEVSFRTQYFFLSGFILTGLCYSHKNLLLFLLTFNSLSSNSKKCFMESGTDYFIYTHPSELFTTYFLVVFHFTFILMFHSMLWHLIDFSKSSLKRFELKALNTVIKVAAVTLCLLNFTFLILIFPNCWGFFESFNENSNKSTLIFFLELKIKDYIHFLESILYTINACFILVVAIHSWLNFQRLEVLLQWKKLFSFFNLTLIIMCCSPDLLSQLLGLLILGIFLEVTVISRTMILKIRKFINIQKASKTFLISSNYCL